MLGFRFAVTLFLVTSAVISAHAAPPWSARVQTVLDVTEPLRFAREDRLPLYLWPAMNAGELTAEQAETLIRELNRRGIGLISSWSPRRRELSLGRAITIARVQKKLGLRVNINATACLSRFFNGAPETAHLDDQGRPFWDESFDVRGGKHHMGCPFALDERTEAIRQQVKFFVEAYGAAQLPLDFVFVDWEIDGPLEVNRAHEAARRCVRCRTHLPDVENFLAFQKAMRDLRSELQRTVLAQTVLERFPHALVGNYGVYPHDGFRYWYDYYEMFVDGQPFLSDQRAKYRHWANEFAATGFTCAMPVVYTWYRTYQWYDFEDSDYRWFYNMLRVASNAGRQTPTNIPIIAFVHWHTTAPPPNPDPSVKPFSAQRYQELLWHMLLRGTDTFFLWCTAEEDAEEVRLVHQVYAEAQRYGEFLERGTPVFFDVPRQPGPVISAIRLDDELLLCRSDFGTASGPVEVTLAGQTIRIPRATEPVLRMRLR
ncbi:MAG TPA: hypothetical protein EYP14_00185 [Planctomycetaceae bacterium]|nr:hypothetical protein [Planctomycetaceae bacterium]